MLKKILFTIAAFLFSISTFSQTGTYLNFDGVNDHIVLTNESNFDFANQLTVEFWMRSSTTPDQWDVLVAKGDDSWRIAMGTDGRVGFAGTPLFGEVWSSTAVTDGNWHHIAAVYDGTSARMYVDGTQEGIISVTGLLNNSSFAVSVGENLQATGRYYQGDMDELRIWSKSRTGSEISDTMNCQLAYGGNRDARGQLEEGIVAYYTFDQGTAAGTNTSETTLTDSSNTVTNNGTLINFGLTGTTSNWVAASPSSVTGISFTSSVTQIACAGSNDGSITITPAGGTAPYTYQWSNGSTSNQLSNLQPGTYNLYGITDANGCTVGGSTDEAIASYTISNTTTITYTATVTQPSCAGANDGSVVITPSGGVAPYTYQWNDGSITSSITGLSPATYELYNIVDSNGCLLGSRRSNNPLESIVIASPSPLSPPQVNSPLNLAQGSVAVPLTATSGGTGLKWYIVATGGTALSEAPTPDTTTLGSTSYWVSSINAAGCESSRSEIEVSVTTPTTHLNFDGFDDIAVYTDFAIASSPKYTKEVWIRPTDLTGERHIFSFESTVSSNASGNNYLWLDNGVLKASMGSINNFGTIEDTTPLIVNQWVHVAVSLDEITGDFKLFKNGVIVDSFTGYEGQLAIDFYIGAKNAVSTSNFKGDIDEVRVWDRALSQNEIQSRMNCELRGDETGLVHHFTLNNGNFVNNGPGSQSLNLQNFANSGSTSNSVSGSPIVSGISNPMPPVTDGFIEYDFNETAVPLTATGSNLLWYTTATGTSSSTAPTPQTFVQGITTYWVSSSNANGCESKRVPINVRVSPNSSDNCWKTVSLSSHGLAIAQDGSLWGWGTNSNGELGMSTPASSASPLRIGDDTGWVDIKAGDSYSLALKEDGTLWASGRNNAGQLGLGDLTSRNQFTQVGTDTDWAIINTKHDASFAIKTNGTLWSWGANGSGQLGLSSTANQNQPIQVGTDTDWESLGVNESASFAIKTDGTFWSSGSGYNGLDSSTTVFTQIGSDTDWRDVSNGETNTFATKDDSSLWGVGTSFRGSLAVFANGSTSTSSRTTFTKAPENNWLKVETGYLSAVALRTDGTLWGWGLFASASFNLGNAARSQPVQIGTSADWVDFTLKSSGNSMLALNSDGNIYAIGTNAGVLGLGDTDNRTSFEALGCPINLDGFSLHFEEIANSSVMDLTSGAVDFADIDNDGDQDLYVTGTTSLFPVAGLYENDGNGNYTAVINTNITPRVFSDTAFSDVDNDGDPDLMVIGLNSSLQASTSLFINDGNGNFTENTSTPFVDVSSGAIAFGHLNADNLIDVIITGRTNSGASTPSIIRMYMNTGSGSFSEVLNAPFNNLGISSIALEDVNNDNHLDIALSGVQTKLYINDGLGVFSELAGTSFIIANDESIALADVNGDTYSDFLITGSIGSTAVTKLYLNSANNTFTEVTPSPFENVSGGDAVFTDTDNDGDIDVLLSGIKDDRNTIVKLYVNDGLGIFTEVNNLPFVPAAGGDLSVADIDSDGDQDLLIMGRNNSRQVTTRLYKNLSNRASWVGGDDNSWTNANNWGDGLIPGLNNEIFIPSTAVNQPVVAASDVAQVASLNIGPNASLDVQGVLKVNSKLNNDGLITFKSNAGGTGQLDQFNALYSGAGAVMTERFIPGGKRAFRFISSSVTTPSDIYANWQEGGVDVPGLGTHITGIDGSRNGFDATTTNNPSMFTYDNTELDPVTNNAWNAATSTYTNLTAGEPIRLFVRGDRTVDLATNQATPSATVLRAAGNLTIGDYNPTLSAGDGLFSFVGNPYQAAVDFNALTINGDLNTNFIYVWDPQLGSTGTYVTIDLSDGSNLVGSSANEFIQPGQAFFVRNNLTVNTSPSITFTESAKNVTEEQLATFSTSTAARYNVQLLSEENDVESVLDGVGLRFRESYSNNVNDNDAGKLWHPGENMAILTDNQFLSIEQRIMPTPTQAVQLSITGYQGSDYRLRLSSTTQQDAAAIYVQDHYLNTLTPLTSSTDYAFTIDPADAASSANLRFSLVFEDGTLSNTTVNKENYQLFPNPTSDQFYIAGLTQEQHVKVFDLLGKQVLDRPNYKSGEAIDISRLDTGVYVVEVVGKDTRFSQKIVKK